MKSPEIGLKSNTKAEMIDLLNARLADAIDLALITKQAHWNLKGPTFIAVRIDDKPGAGTTDRDPVQIRQRFMLGLGVRKQI